MSYSGIVNVYKEQGFTSFDVVAKMRGIYGTKKVGHTGTLDPMAEGVLLVCVGRATKLSDILTSGDKCYHAVMQLGISTDTEDISGEVLDSRDISSGDYDLSDEHIEEVIAGFRGKQKQVPPMYSAIKVKGKKTYYDIDYLNVFYKFKYDGKKYKAKVTSTDSFFKSGFWRRTYQSNNTRTFYNKWADWGEMEKYIYVN